ncbi:hypothetical protein Hanom_Chr09g00806041 [Helianthus anomalus]
MKVLNFHDVHISQVNPFGLSRISNFELSYRARGRVLDLQVFRYFYEFRASGDWYTSGHHKKSVTTER